MGKGRVALLFYLLLAVGHWGGVAAQGVVDSQEGAVGSGVEGLAVHHLLGQPALVHLYTGGRR